MNESANRPICTQNKDVMKCAHFSIFFLFRYLYWHTALVLVFNHNRYILVPMDVMNPADVTLGSDIDYFP
jgi:hypothetical protein